MGNVYDILSFMPAYEHEDMASSYEGLAQQLVRSGLLRINADRARNFVTYSGPSFDKSFSKREMTDPNLIDQTKQLIRDTLPGAAGVRGVEDAYQKLLEKFNIAGTITFEREMQIARLIVQACHPSVLLLLLYERVQIFVSYSHNVADLMAMHFWEGVGTSGGLQSVSGDGTAVYISCGGNPFIEKEEHKTYIGDGFSALARMMVIAGQELGHYADLIRNENGQHVGRHSALLAPLRAKAHVKEARLNDLGIVKKWYNAVLALGINELIEQERSLQFYEKNRKNSLLRWWQELRVKRNIQSLRRSAQVQHNALVCEFPTALFGSQQFGHNLARCLSDMAFNLAPDADAYKRSDPEEEEAILCVEALARVPQQIHKWGHKVTEMMWPNLYKIYMQEVIVTNITYYEYVSGKKFYDFGPARLERPISGIKISRLRNNAK